MMQKNLKRILRFIKPKPRLIPAPVEKILDNPKGKSLVENFNDFYYSSRTAGDLHWKNDPLIKNPCDIWMMIELLQKLKPSIIIETGTHMGGSASLYADVIAMLGINCAVITIDINPKWSFNPEAKNIYSLVGRSTDQKLYSHVCEIVDKVSADCPGAVLVTLDSDHSYNNVFSELELYSKFVTMGSYIIVEDTNINGHPSFHDHGPGPFEAAADFVEQSKEFEVDRECERFLLTFNPKGYLKRISER